MTDGQYEQGNDGFSAWCVNICAFRLQRTSAFDLRVSPVIAAYLLLCVKRKLQIVHWYGRSPKSGILARSSRVETHQYERVNVVSVWTYPDCSTSNGDKHTAFPKRSHSIHGGCLSESDTYAGMRPNVSTEFTQFDRGITTFFATMRFLQCVSRSKSVMPVSPSNDLTCIEHVESVLRLL